MKRAPRGPLTDDHHRAVRAFERSVLAPLLDGEGASTEHPREYNRFFRAIGSHRSYFATSGAGEVVGTLTGVAWTMRIPGGGRRRAVYLMRVRVAPHARTGPAMVYMLARVLPFVARHGCATLSLLQVGHTMKQGKIASVLGMPSPRRVGVIRVLTWALDAPDGAHPEGVRAATEAEVRSRFAALTRDRIAPVGGHPLVRSMAPPRWMVAEDGSACGCIEDYARALEWRTSRGPVPTQTHLSFFGWSSVDAGATFFRKCMRVASASGATRLRAVIDDRDADAFVRAVGIPPIGDVGWSILATGMVRFPDARWVVHPSEI